MAGALLPLLLLLVASPEQTASFHLDPDITRSETIMEIIIDNVRGHAHVVKHALEPVVTSDALGERLEIVVERLDSNETISVCQSCLVSDWLNIALRQLIYRYVETDDDNDDELDRKPDLNFKDKDYFTSHTT